MKGTVFPIIILVLLVAIFSLQLLTMPSGQSDLHPNQLRELAAVLEQEELYEAAIQTYRSYLDKADIPEGVRANILYRIGQIYQERLTDYENALAVFIRLRELYPQAGGRLRRPQADCGVSGSVESRRGRSKADAGGRRFGRR